MASTTVSQIALILVFLSGSLASFQKEHLQYYIFNNEHYNEELCSENYHELIDVSLQTNVIIRGCGNGSTWADELVEEYLKQGCYNVILVDYSGSDDEEYNPSTVKEAEEIGCFIGEFLHELTGACGTKLSDVHVIGFGVGAHIAGFAGKNVQKLGRECLGRITGLDAEYAVFCTVGEEQRLSKRDAEIVVALHTNGGVNGILQRYGLIEFYANDGVNQPGCRDVKGECSHQRATEYFVEAVGNQKGFVARECNSYTLYELGACDHAKSLKLGGQFTVKDKGTYYFKTNTDKPYCKE